MVLTLEMEVKASEASQVGRELNKLAKSGELLPVDTEMFDLKLLKGRFTSIYFQDKNGVDHVLFGRPNDRGTLDYTPLSKKKNELPVPDEFKQLRNLAKAEWIYPGSVIKGVFIQSTESYRNWLNVARQYVRDNYLVK